MIQFNKTIFQFTKRFALVVMLIGISNAILAGGNNAVMYSRVEANVDIEGTENPSAVGKVYVSAEPTTTPDWTQNPTSLGQMSDANASKENTYHLYANHEWAKTDNNDLGYLFIGWYDGVFLKVANSHFLT